ncbi:aldo/keto reductase [Halobacillus litoralis]|uniref:aldo/keto reductase n=1 Tax=Halobacillus litoralis TaxID=45668 RepID=UPI001CD64A6E|nr:aldo/keto reductase [Halobacillus litoralis]MCA0971450.1 aldo/keto reductase [Halobacillus litoralis]
MGNETPEKTLHDGLTIPSIGFGTYALNGSEGIHAITSAIDEGYRLIDTAYNYENEGAVGRAIQRSSVPRHELRVTSKLPGRYHGYKKAVTAIQESLYRLNLDYFDLYLVHWPNPKQDQYLEAWQALVDAKKWGLIRSIGTSNFLPEHIDRLEQETGELPTINQVELHPYFNQEQQRAYHHEKNIQTESWSPLYRISDIVENKTLQNIAAQHEKSVTQIILRWHYQLGTVPIPKSSSAKRQRENLSIFDFTLSESEMGLINELSKPDGRINDQDPAVYEEF